MKASSFLGHSATLGVAAMTLLSASQAAAQATIEDLWITEVWPATGQVEITNVSSEAFTTPGEVVFCHRFRYPTAIPAGQTFAPGETRVFTINNLSQASSDLWIYSSRSFGSSTALLNGVLWGGPNIGRTSVAVGGNDWDAASSFVAAPSAIQSISLTGPDPRSAANWSVGEPNIGSFTPGGDTDPVNLSIEVVGDSIRLSWTGGAPPFRVLASEDLQTFAPITQRIAETELTVDLSDATRRFFIVESEAAPEAQAQYRAIIRSSWTGLAFAQVPPSPMFGQIVGATHNDQVSIWRPGAPASGGMEQLAEEDSTATLISEVNAAINAGTAGELINISGITQELGTANFEFTARAESPLLTIASRLSSSPDWFAGVWNESLYDENGNFLQMIELGMNPYDAGTEEGSEFDSNGADTSPAEEISSLFGQGAFGPSFTLGIGADPLPVAALILERIDSPN